MKNIAIIPIKKKSTRFPKKNKTLFLGKPIFYHTIKAAIKSKLFDKVIISTDDEEVKNYCRKINNKKIFILNRPKKLAKNNSSLNDVIIHVIKYYINIDNFDNFCLLFATSPLRNHIDIANAYKILKNKKCNAVIGSRETLEYYPSFIKSSAGYIKHLFKSKTKTTNLMYQDVPNTYIDNSSLAWVTATAFEKYKTWIPKNSIPYIMPIYKSVDINFPNDIDLLKFYYAKYEKKK